MVQLRCRQDEDRARYDHESGHERGRERPGRKSSRPGPRISSINRSVGYAVKRHRGGSRRNHRYDDPRQLVAGWPTTCRQHGAAERKWKSKYGMLPLDHLKRGT